MSAFHVNLVQRAIKNVKRYCGKHGLIFLKIELLQTQKKKHYFHNVQFGKKKKKRMK